MKSEGLILNRTVVVCYECLSELASYQCSNLSSNQTLSAAPTTRTKWSSGSAEFDMPGLRQSICHEHQKGEIEPKTYWIIKMLINLTQFLHGIFAHCSRVPTLKKRVMGSNQQPLQTQQKPETGPRVFFKKTGFSRGSFPLHFSLILPFF